MKINFWYMFKVFAKMILSLLKMFSVFLIPLVILFILMVIMVIKYIIKYRFIEHYRPVKFKGKRIKRKSVLKRLLIDFPKQYSYDLIHQDPNHFDKFGIHMIVGEQGAGKSTLAAYFLMKWKEEFPKLKVYTNMGYKYENAPLDYWQELITRKNGKYGVVNVIDDVKAWWSNRDSKNLPPEVLAEICQERKQKTAIIGTIQVFGELPKAFRSQTHFVYIPYTFFGCLTVVFKSKAKYWNAEKERFTRTCGMFFFVHNKKLRESFDTYKKIEKYKDYNFEVSPYFPVGEKTSQTCEVVATGS